jgi:hypothetical protein
MKAYHLDKATDPTHLPSWLFTEHERRPVGQLRLANQHDNDDGIADVLSSPLSPSRGLRAHASPISPRSPADMPTSKAAAHLKALRDAKRNILTNVTSPTEESASDRDEAQRRRAQRRMGMSVGPEKYGRF